MFKSCIIFYFAFLKFYSGSKIAEDFNLKFGSSSFHIVLSQFSQAKPLSSHLDPKHPKEKHANLIEMLIRLLQRKVLIQLHYFVFLMPKKVEHKRLDQYSSKISDLSFGQLKYN